jgi:hypothetical protein
MVHFARWRPFNQNATPRSAVRPPAREDINPGKGVPADLSASLRSDRGAIPEAAE